MINFVSTFPPIICGIGAYINYLVSKMPDKEWKVISFKLNESLLTDEPLHLNKQVVYNISLSNSCLPSPIDGEVFWFQHAFGIWGRTSPAFLHLVKEAKRKGKKVIITFHSIHFESEETAVGMRKNEENLLKNVLPFSDAITVFTDGAYQAVIRRFPEYKNKIVVLRHGVHLYPYISKDEARKRLLEYLQNQEDIPLTQREELKQIYHHFFSPKTIVLGNVGFITPDKDPVQLYQLGQLVQTRLPFNRVIVLYIGRIQKRKDRKMVESLPILENLRAVHDGRKNLFFEHYLPDELLPFAFRSLDFSVFWSKSATQSGRMAHAMGTGTCIVGRRIEGIGETLDLAGLPSAATLKELAEKIRRLVFDSKLKKEAEKLSREYAQQFSFERQAQKHLLLKEAVLSGEKLPILDKTAFAGQERRKDVSKLPKVIQKG